MNTFKELFWNFDADGSGEIDRHELRAIFLRYDPEVDEIELEDRLDQVFKEVNRGGGDEATIDFGEFVHLLRRARLAGDKGLFLRLVDAVDATINEDSGMVFFCECETL